MGHKKPVTSAVKKIFLVLFLFIIFLFFYLGSGMMRLSNNTDTLDTVFTQESCYAPGYQLEEELQILSYDQALSVLSLTEDEYLYDIGSRVSDSIESAGLKIKQEILDQEKTRDNEKAASEESSLPEQQDPAPPLYESAEINLAYMINQIRSSRGLQTLLPNPILGNIARARSQDMLNRNYFSHYTPEGKNIGILLQENGIMYACCAENLGQASPPSWGSPETIINMWMGSSSHQANLLNPHFGQMGLGIVDAGGRRVVTLVLINR